VSPVAPIGPVSPFLPGASTIFRVSGILPGEDIVIEAGLAIGTILTSMAIL
jgi:hypothetical protein